MKKLPLTIIILTDRSDARFIKSLASAQIADEVIIVNNKSGSNWDVLKKKYSFKLTHWEKGINNFAEVRNEAMQGAKNEWVMFLDSDETLAGDSEKAIKEVILGGLYDGVTVTRQDIFLGKKLSYGEAGTMQLIRLFKKDLTIFNRAIHEVAKVNGKIGSSDIVINHYAHDSINDFIRDVSWYAERVALQRSLDKFELFTQLFLYPPAKFLLNFVFKLGFLDGWRGLVYAVVMSIHSFSVRVFVYEQNQ